MRSRVRLAAFRILALREEFTARELSNALSLLNKWSFTLDRMQKKPSRSAKAPQANPTQFSQIESRIVTELRERDPERYAILSKIDQSIRLGAILPRLSDIRRAGCSLDKKFNSGRSKKDAVPRLMTMLAAIPVKDLEIVFQKWRLEAPSTREIDTEYDELAEFLIKGRK